MIEILVGYDYQMMNFQKQKIHTAVNGILNQYKKYLCKNISYEYQCTKAKKEKEKNNALNSINDIKKIMREMDLNMLNRYSHKDVICEYPQEDCVYKNK